MPYSIYAESNECRDFQHLKQKGYFLIHYASKEIKAATYLIIHSLWLLIEIFFAWLSVAELSKLKRLERKRNKSSIFPIGD